VLKPDTKVFVGRSTKAGKTTYKGPGERSSVLKKVSNYERRKKTGLLRWGVKGTKLRSRGLKEEKRVEEYGGDLNIMGGKPTGGKRATLYCQGVKKKRKA